MLTVTKDLVLPTTITGSYPKPNWYTQNLQTRAFKVAITGSSARGRAPTRHSSACSTAPADARNVAGESGAA